MEYLTSFFTPKGWKNNISQLMQSLPADPVDLALKIQVKIMLDE